MPQRPGLPLRQHAVLQPPPEHPVLVTASIGPDGELVALWSSAAGREALYRRTDAGRGSSPRARAPQAPAATVTVGGRPIRIAALPLAFPFVQPLPQGRVLLAGARCWWRSGGAEENAVIHREDGSVERRGVLGDGIEHLATTPSGRIWVGYFDEGVVGNFGWGGAAGPEPLGAAGLVRFGHDLRPDWQFPQDSEHGPISDCYALNVSGEAAWACTYTDFPVLSIENGTVRSRRNQLAGVKALLLGGYQVALFGGYEQDRFRLVPAVLEPEWIRPGPVQFDVTLPDGSPPPPRADVLGRGADLHLITQTHWYRLGLDDLIVAAAAP